MLRNKYVRYSPDITFEVFKKIWDKLIATGWKPYVASTDAEDMYKKWSKDCILTYGPSHTPNIFGIYSEDLLLSDDREVFVENLINISPKFVLPEKWCIRVDKENYRVLSKWRTDGDLDSTNFSYYIMYEGYEKRKGYCVRSIPDGVTLISFEQFKRFVLGEEGKEFCVQGDGTSWFGRMIPLYLTSKGGKMVSSWNYNVRNYFFINNSSQIEYSLEPKGLIVTKTEVMEALCYKGAIKGGVGSHGEAVIAHLKEKGATKNTNWTGCDNLFYYIIVRDEAYTLEQSALVPEGYHEEILKKKIPSIYMGAIKADGNTTYGRKVIAFLVKQGGKNLADYIGSTNSYYYVTEGGLIKYAGVIPTGYTEVSRAEVEDAYVEEVEPVKDAPVPLVEVYAKPNPVVENITNIYFPKVEEIL